MDSTDKELLEIAVKSDMQIKRLYEQHRLLDRKIENLTSRNILTGSDEYEIKRLKKQKLLGKDNLMRLLVQFRGRVMPKSKLN